MPETARVPEGAAGEAELPRLTGWLRPAVRAAARVNTSIHRKLLFGFLIGALLLVGMAVLSLVVLARMNGRMGDLSRQATKVSRARQMLYDVTGQTHYRAMALLMHDDPKEVETWNGKVQTAKGDFAGLLATMERDDPANMPFYRNLASLNDVYKRSSDQVVAQFQKGDIASAERIHLEAEHPISQRLENQLNPFIKLATAQMAQAQQAFTSDRGFLTRIVIAFSAASVILALLLGFALSWAFILPVRKMQLALAQITTGNFDQRVEVPNRDEFGRLGHDLNSTSERLAQLFETQRSLTRRLGESNTSLVRASEAKSRFLASVSHELRTPMNAILGFTDALLAGVDGPLNAEQEASLGWVQRGGRDLLGLINEILDLSKIEAGKLTLDLQPFDPRELVESVTAQHRSLAAQKGIRLNWTDAGAPAQVVLDRQRVRQILVNLLGNALKFTAAGEVDVEAGSGEDGTLQVAVRDTGPGIPADQHEAIFEEFRQGETDAGGTGLGLAISRRLSRAMGGDVTVQSEPDRGSVFHLALPIDARATVPGPVELAPESALDGEQLVLSVDDDPSVAPLLQKMLADNGYRVVASKSPSVAVSDARRLRPAAILLDLLMPERDGKEILRELKEDPATSGIPVIVLSVVDSPEVPAVADGHLRKPVTREALLSALARNGSSAARTQ